MYLRNYKNNGCKFKGSSRSLEDSKFMLEKQWVWLRRGHLGLEAVQDNLVTKAADSGQAAPLK